MHQQFTVCNSSHCSVYQTALSDGITKADYNLVMHELLSIATNLGSLAILSEPGSFRIQDMVLAFLETTAAYVT